MNQSTFIAASLLAGFVLYLAANNRLVTYAAVLWGPTAQPVLPPTKSTGPGVPPLPLAPPSGGGGSVQVPGLEDLGKLFDFGGGDMGAIGSDLGTLLLETLA